MSGFLGSSGHLDPRYVMGLEPGSKGSQMRYFNRSKWGGGEGPACLEGHALFGYPGDFPRCSVEVRSNLGGAPGGFQEEVFVLRQESELA